MLGVTSVTAINNLTTRTMIALWRIALVCLMMNTASSFAFTVSTRNVRTIREHTIHHRHHQAFLNPTTTTTSRQTTNHQSKNLLMHLGHSHDHHHRGVDHAHHPTPVLSTLRWPTSAKQRIAWSVSLLTAAAGSLLLRATASKAQASSTAVLSYYYLLFLPSLIQFGWPLLRSVFLKLRDRVVLWKKRMILHAPIPHTTTNADRVTILGGVINLILSVSKLIVGIQAHSSVLIADAGHSLSDLLSDIVTYLSIAIGRLPPDEDHPYGHGKFESIGSLFLSILLITTGFSIGVMSNQKLIAALSGGVSVPKPGLAALVMAAISVFSKEWLFRITKVVGEKINSPVIIANAWHHRSDAYSSILAVFSIMLARNAWVVCDAAAGLLVAAIIGVTGAEILGDSINQLTDRSPDDLVEDVKEIVHHHEDVKRIEKLRARHVGSTITTVDLTVRINGASQTAVEDDLRTSILELKDPDNDTTMDVEVRALPSKHLPPKANGQRQPIGSATSTMTDTHTIQRSIQNAIEGTDLEMDFVNFQSKSADVYLKLSGEALSKSDMKDIASRLGNQLKQYDLAPNIYLDMN